MPSLLSYYLPPNTLELFREFESACADEIGALYERSRASTESAAEITASIRGLLE